MALSQDFSQWTDMSVGSGMILSRGNKEACAPSKSQFSPVHSLSHVRLFVIPWPAVHQASLSISNSWSLLELMSIESMMSSNHLILHCPLLHQPSNFPASGSFQMGQFFASGGQSFGLSALASVLIMNIQDGFT